MTPYQAGIRILAQWVLEILQAQVVESESVPSPIILSSDTEIVTTYERQDR